MADTIQLLPDSVANQIAAGEVIQRPASLVKELMENAIDAGANEICVTIKDAGRTLVQVVDNGCGMSETDARMSFERHATSKIKCASDLFSIRTMGFRGEALASIAAVAHVELITKKRDAELGTKIVISASKVESQVITACSEGCCLSVKNLFFNIPARRRFLKSNATEERHIINEFQRVVIANPQIYFKLFNNDLSLYNLPVSNVKQRIINIVGKQISSHLIPIEVNTTIVKITGFIGTPQGAKKTAGDQFFFVNSRFMKHPYLHKAVVAAYSKLIPSDTFPPYFIFFDVNPELIDINIHPTKTEIKFEDEIAIWKILNAGIRESLGKFNVVPSIDFDTEGMIDIPVLRGKPEVSPPHINYNPDYDPFDNPKDRQRYGVPKKWETLYDTFLSAKNEYRNNNDSVILSSKSIGNENLQQLPLNIEQPLQSLFFQIKNRYILMPVKSGLMIIDQRRAHERILFERFMSSIQNNRIASQLLLFPETISFNLENSVLINEIEEDLKIFGFDIHPLENDTFIIKGVPVDLSNINVATLLDEIIETYKSREINAETEIKEELAMVLAKKGCLNSNEHLTPEDMSSLVNQLFRCQKPKFTPTGKTIISIFSNEELEIRFK
ncbi:MAG: DNA mismatch repair endonuclease MutL [Marinilabiliaceae bacterium]|nr:DNA mismatch repair endonuclease MutL [Marinilabiliaceae bacterium]